VRGAATLKRAEGHRTASRLLAAAAEGAAERHRRRCAHSRRVQRVAPKATAAAVSERVVAVDFYRHGDVLGVARTLNEQAVAGVERLAVSRTQYAAIEYSNSSPQS
jgi:hypothetical protein